MVRTEKVKNHNKAGKYSRNNRNVGNTPVGNYIIIGERCLMISKGKMEKPSQLEFLKLFIPERNSIRFTS